jgi:hypothetical protein
MQFPPFSWYLFCVWTKYLSQCPVLKNPLPPLSLHFSGLICCCLRIWASGSQTGGCSVLRGWLNTRLQRNPICNIKFSSNIQICCGREGASFQKVGNRWFRLYSVKWWYDWWTICKGFGRKRPCPEVLSPAAWNELRKSMKARIQDNLCPSRDSKWLPANAIQKHCCCTNLCCYSLIDRDHDSLAYKTEAKTIVFCFYLYSFRHKMAPDSACRLRIIKIIYQNEMQSVMFPSVQLRVGGRECVVTDNGLR